MPMASGPCPKCRGNGKRTGKKLSFSGFKNGKPTKIFRNLAVWECYMCSNHFVTVNGTQHSVEILSNVQIT